MVFSFRICKPKEKGNVVVCSRKDCESTGVLSLKYLGSNSGIPLLEYLEKEGSICMDVGCGSGFALCELAEKFPSCSFVGVDLLADAIEAAKGVHRQTLTNILRQQTPSLSPSLLLSLPLSFLLIRV